MGLLIAFELSNKSWRLGFTDGTRRRTRSVPARELEQLWAEIETTKVRWNVPADAPIRSCYEAGRDGFWLHRALAERGIENLVIDSASIPVDRRAKRAKSDGIDVGQLLDLLRRFVGGERRALRPVRVPSETEEDLRRLHRERNHLVKLRTAERNRLKGLLVLHGIVLERITDCAPGTIDRLRDWRGRPLAPQLREELLRGYERFVRLCEQIDALEAEQMKRLRAAGELGGPYQLMQLLLMFKGIGVQSAWVLVNEIFGWRHFNNRRELGACVGLTPTPYQSGDSQREQGISKAGNRRLRALLIELAWSWQRHQPTSALTTWFKNRFGTNKRNRKVGIVALARKLLILLWNVTRTGEVPTGTQMKDALV
jgi:transposase